MTRHNNRPVIAASTLGFERLSLHAGEPVSMVCPTCERWTLWRRGMLKAHSADHVTGARCTGSNQRIYLDVDPAQWLRWLPEFKAAVELARRRTDRVHLPHGHRTMAPPPLLRPAA
ncbi:hypothetical protein [Actinomadura fibrosa]|uniref:Uncharacterized protein n=1 Tax=Actinomadura fibrosa TaxID=111802 RepID=A0ABW2XM28_9ACTN|nr:hypothetical protein [Actinomadura fibrosa]